MTSNTAAWLVEAKAYPLEVKESPLGVPGDHQLLIRNRAVAVNPIDGKLQALALYPLPYPTILGQDIAGEVAQVGAKVTRFKEGDRVLANVKGFATGAKEQCGFQAYTVVEEDVAAALPAGMSFEVGATIPLGVSTAACGLFLPDYLGLQLPTHPPRTPTGQVVLVWGGASCVGSTAIQLLVAAGYEPIATASPKNFDLVRRLGATHVADYASDGAVSELAAAVGGRPVAGVFDAIGVGAYERCVEFALRCGDGEGGGVVRFVATVLPMPVAPTEGVGMKKIYAPAIFGTPVAPAVWEAYLPAALASGSFVSAVAPVVAGTGLEHVQTAIDLQRKGTSAQKVVVSL
jgi:NADPH:quinone reductase-like Zn-dependent oxidoreductase